MSYLLQRAWEVLTEYSNNPDGYKYLPFHGSLIPVLIVDLAYVAFVFKIGPWFMRNRQPYNLKKTMLAYNIFQIIYNSIMGYYCIKVALIAQPTPIRCMQRLDEDNPYKMIEIALTIGYMYNKFLDYLDTVFMVLRKSYKQVTFLHVYHHIMMTCSAFFYPKYYGGGGHISIVGVLNTIVHVFMYTYYLMSALRPNVKKSLWWKKYITMIQLVQFVLILIHQSWPVLFEPDCPFPKIWLFFTNLQAVTMIYLFGNFYRKNYMQPAVTAKQPSKHSMTSTKKVAAKAS